MPKTIFPARITRTVQFAKGIRLGRTATAISAATDEVTIIGVTNTTAPRTITLSTADVLSGIVFVVKDESGGAAANNITIDTEGSEKIDGADSISITANYGVARIYSDGTNFFTW